MLKEIPAKLYRGDSDPNDKRYLKTTVHLNQLHSNLIDGGEGRKITEIPLRDLINKHVGYGWSETHFLSFSENKKTAIRFGLSCKESVVDQLFENYNECYSNNSWNFVVISIDTTIVNWGKIGDGIYEGFYPPELLKFKKLGDQYRVVLLDVVKILSSAPEPHKYRSAIDYATKDSEWLILPATPVPFNFNKIEYSSILDGACISNIIKYSS